MMAKFGGRKSQEEEHCPVEPAAWQPGRAAASHRRGGLARRDTCPGGAVWRGG